MNYEMYAWTRENIHSHLDVTEEDTDFKLDGDMAIMQEYLDHTITGPLSPLLPSSNIMVTGPIHDEDTGEGSWEEVSKKYENWDAN